MKLTSVSVVVSLLEGFFDNAIYDIAQDFGDLSTSNDINLNRDACWNAMPTINLLIPCNPASIKRLKQLEKQIIRELQTKATFTFRIDWFKWIYRLG